MEAETQSRPIEIIQKIIRKRNEINKYKIMKEGWNGSNAGMEKMKKQTIKRGRN